MYIIHLAEDWCKVLSLVEKNIFENVICCWCDWLFKGKFIFTCKYSQGVCRNFAFFKNFRHYSKCPKIWNTLFHTFFFLPKLSILCSFVLKYSVECQTVWTLIRLLLPILVCTICIMHLCQKLWCMEFEDIHHKPIFHAALPVNKHVNTFFFLWMMCTKNAKQKLGFMHLQNFQGLSTRL